MTQHAPSPDPVEKFKWQLVLARISVRQACRKTGYSYDRLQRVLRGDRKPRTGELERLARLLRLS